MIQNELSWIPPFKLNKPPNYKWSDWWIGLIEGSDAEIREINRKEGFLEDLSKYDLEIRSWIKNLDLRKPNAVYLAQNILISIGQRQPTIVKMALLPLPNNWVDFSDALFFCLKKIKQPTIRLGKGFSSIFMQEIGQPDPVKEWLLVSFDKTIRLQLNRAFEIKRIN